MTSTNIDTYEASASDCITTKPPLLDSRKPQHRKLHSRRSAYYKRRQASYQTRRRERIRNSDNPELSSSDEHDAPPPLTKSGLPNPDFLRYMPRPSDIVQAIDDGSASDAGFDTRARQAHKRRVEAMRILLTSIDSRGVIIPVPHWKRSRSRLTKYTTYMNPPQEDMNIPDLRVPLPLLSRYYRGSLLAVHRVGRPTKRRKRETDNSASPEASAFEYENLESSSGSDFDVVEPRTFVKSEPEVIDDDSDTPTSNVRNTDKDGDKKAAFSKSAFLEELERVADGSSSDIADDDIERLRGSGVRKSNTSSGSDEEDEAQAETTGRGETEEEDEVQEEGEVQEEHEVPAKPKGQTQSRSGAPSSDDVQEIDTPEKISEIDRLREMLAKNPELLFEEQKPLDKEALTVKGADIEEHSSEAEDESDSNLTQFQRDKRMAMMFSHNTAKRPRATARDMEEKYLHPSKRSKHIPAEEVTHVPAANGAPDSRMNLKFTMKLMNKMGFTGRLGKKEDGRRDPVLPTRHSFRSGLGSRPAQVPARGGRDESLLPTKFKGKSVENGTPAGSSNAPGTTGDDEVRANGVAPSYANGNSTEGGDVFTRRRKRSARASEKETHPDRDPVASGTRSGSKRSTKKASSRQLDDDDVYETEDEASGLDNGRRAILIDMDALIKDSAKRRLDAIEKVLSDASLKLDVKKLLAREPRDLCEADMFCKVLGHANVKPHDMEGYKDKLDEAFESLPPPELDMDLLDMLRQYSKDVHFGIFHRGSRRRLQYDLKATGLTNSFLQEVCTTVKHEEKWPYVDTWQDLTCRVGVGPRQCLYILNEDRVVKCKREFRPSAGVAAGACLGAQTAVWDKVDDGVKLCIRNPRQEVQVKKINNSSAYSDRKTVLDGLLRNRMPVLKRRRVLAQYDVDLLWYSAVVQYEGKKDGKSWIKFDKFENTEWVCNEDLVDLCRRDYRKLIREDFPGLLDSSDASVL